MSTPRLEALYATKPFRPSAEDVAEDFAPKAKVVGGVGLIISGIGLWKWIGGPSETGLMLVLGQVLVVVGLVLFIGSIVLTWGLRAGGAFLPNVQRRVEFFYDTMRICYEEGGVRAFNYVDLALVRHNSMELRLLFVDGTEVVVPATAFKDREYFEMACTHLTGRHELHHPPSIHAA
jgi:hypothetical protein